MKHRHLISLRTAVLAGIILIHTGWGMAQEKEKFRASPRQHVNLINPLAGPDSRDWQRVPADSRGNIDQLLSPLRVLQPQSGYSIQENWDTIGIRLITVPALINSDGGGYVSGNNFFGDLAKANFIKESWANSYIMGVLLWFGYVTGNEASWIEVSIWDDSGGPFNKVASEYILLGDAMVDAILDQMTYVQFSSPVPNPGTYYAGIVLPQGASDTVALYSSRIDDLPEGNAWEMWSDGNWHPVSDPLGWNLELTFGIFPVEYTPTSVDEYDDNASDFLFSIFPNPVTGRFYLELNKPLPGSMRLQIFDITGNKVQEKWLDNSGNSRFLVVDPVTLAKGIYIIRLDAGTKSGVRSLVVL